MESIVNKENFREISQLITDYYDRLMYIVLIQKVANNPNSTNMYNNTTKKIKFLVELEKEMYKSLLSHNKDLLELLKEFGSDTTNEVDDRCYKRLKTINKVAKEITNDKEEMLEIFAIVKALLLLQIRISNLPIDIQFILLIYFEGIKIKYLTSTPLLEKIALKYNFDLLEINAYIQRNNIKPKNFKIQITGRIIKLYNRLTNCPKTSNNVLNTIIVGINLAQIEILLEYLDKDSLLFIKQHIETNNNNNNNKEITNILRRLLLNAYGK